MDGWQRPGTGRAGCRHGRHRPVPSPSKSATATSTSSRGPVAYTTEAQTIERGRYLFTSRGCTDCHGAQGTGREFVNDGKGTRLAGPTSRRPAWWRATSPRTGTAPSATASSPMAAPLLVMPSEDYNRLTNDDLNALVSYVRQLPAKEGTPAAIELPRPAWVLYGLGVIPDAASRIDHHQAPSRPVPAGVTVANGQYVANMCIGLPRRQPGGRQDPRRPAGLAGRRRHPPRQGQRDGPLPHGGKLRGHAAQRQAPDARRSRSCPSNRWASSAMWMRAPCMPTCKALPADGSMPPPPAAEVALNR